MPESSTNPDIPFSTGDWVIDQAGGQRAQFTGNWTKAGPLIMVEVRYSDGQVKKRPLSALKAVVEEASLESRLRNNEFSKIRDLQRLVTFEKLKGTLHEVVYSMEAAQIDFYPYQFKPVLKFINSPSERLIIADEVGLGKTIESALIWTELQARRQARRLLVVCPKILTEKWREELRNKFLFDARIIDFRDLQQEIADLRNSGPFHPFVLIASYAGLRSPKKEIDLLNSPPEDDEEGSAKTRFLRELRHWNYSHPPFDMVIFDEAHYMRNRATSTFNLGESLASHNETAVLCVSATPVHNSNTDLHSLLQLIDRDFFETQGMFEELLEANRPAIHAINALSRTPIQMDALQESVGGMAESQFINNSPLFRQFLDQLGQLEQTPDNKPLLAKTQDTAEKLNLLGGYINRTRRIQVEGEKPVRKPIVIAVSYTDEEMLLYRAILELVRRQCSKNSEPFHVFRVLGLQLRAASCLPAIAEQIRKGRLGSLGGSVEEMMDLLAEGVGDEVYDDFGGKIEGDFEVEATDLRHLVKYDFEKNDTKYAQLQELLANNPDKKEKIVIFAYYRPTLAYLRRRLIEDGIDVAVIHGDVGHEQRWRELDRFRDPSGPRILLSSEVGSEGIDLQFSRFLVNYDLPWNPMRVEQRIGRIDRVGQKAKVLSIFNFKVAGTIEERLYDRLHEKLLKFANSLGDLEAIIGDEVKKLTVDLLSQQLSPEDEAARIDAAELVIEKELMAVRQLEDSGDALVALSDYVQKKIREKRETGQFVQFLELEDYVTDFFERNFQGTEVNHNTPADGCIHLRLSFDAMASLSDFVRNDHSLSARPLRQRELSITFSREAHARLTTAMRRRVHFVNHLSPLIRWITQLNRDGEHSFHDVSALSLKSSKLPAGTYIYRIQRWLLKGLMQKDSMNFVVQSLDSGNILDSDESERIVQAVLREGEDWDYAKWDGEQLVDGFNELDSVLTERFGEAVGSFDAENETAIQIRVRRASNHWDRLIGQSEQAIQTMITAGRKESIIRGRQTRLKNEREHKEQRIRELQKGGETDYDVQDVAAGIFKITR